MNLILLKSKFFTQILVFLLQIFGFLGKMTFYLFDLCLEIFILFERIFVFLFDLSVNVIVLLMRLLELWVHFLADHVHFLYFLFVLIVFLLHMKTVLIEFFDLYLVTEIVLELPFWVFELNSQRLNFQRQAFYLYGLKDNHHV